MLFDTSYNYNPTIRMFIFPTYTYTIYVIVWADKKRINKG